MDDVRSITDEIVTAGAVKKMHFQGMSDESVTSRPKFVLINAVSVQSTRIICTTLMLLEEHRKRGFR